MLAEVPRPKTRHGHFLIRTKASLISAGTERMLVDFGKSSFVNKARQQPDKVRQVLDKIRTDGLLATLDAVQSKLDQPVALGYCNVGTVVHMEEPRITSFEAKEVEFSQGCTDLTSHLALGDRVASNGPHAEIVCVPRNLCAKVPDKVSDEEAAFTVLGAIALQGIRLAGPTLGEAFVVTGLGLIGLIAVQLLRANGCRVLGIDYDSGKLQLAKHFGAETVDLSHGEDPMAVSESFSRGQGVDGVIITAATKSSEPVHQAALMCRKRGRIVLVGITGLDLSRDDFYKKELSFQVSCSYGPGRYDPYYEEKGHDYPIGYVRWTEQRNFEAVLDMMAAGKLDVKPLISHRYPLKKAVNAYELLSGKEPSLGIMLKYDQGEGGRKPKEQNVNVLDADRTVQLNANQQIRTLHGAPVVGFIGAGNYAGRVLIPVFKKAGAQLKSVASNGGVSAVHFGNKYGVEEATTEADSIIADEKITAVVIATRHNSHAQFVCKALRARKHIFVEKPLCVSLDELREIEEHYSTYSTQQPALKLIVGFNRRFAPQVRKMKELLGSTKHPKSIVITVNAGAIPADHWTQDIAVGGGRIVGEACHYIDLLRFLAGETITRHNAVYLGKDEFRDKAVLTLLFADGSMGTVHYLANGHKSFLKERIEVFCGGRVLQLDNFRKLKGYGWPGFRNMNIWRQDKGQRACVEAFIDAVRSEGPGPIPFEEIVEVTRVTIQLATPDFADYLEPR